MKRVMATFLAASLMIVPLSLEAKKCKSKSFCTICAKKLCVQNANIPGTLTVGTITLTGGGTTGGTTITSFSDLDNSLIPFASDPIAIAGISGSSLLTTGLVMGFGNNVLLTGITNTDTVSEGGFAFSVPSDGTLHNLQVSVDALYLLGLGNGGTSFTFNFTLLHSSAVNGTTTPYTATGLTASVTLTPLAGLLGGLRSASGSSAASIPVTAGDRIVMLVQPTTPVPALTISLIAFNAGVLYSPTI